MYKISFIRRYLHLASQLGSVRWILCYLPTLIAWNGEELKDNHGLKVSQKQT